MLVLTSILIAALSDARVTFPYSEVVQPIDIVNKVASFNCDNGCKVYAGGIDDALVVTQNGVIIANYTDIAGNYTHPPKGLELPAGENYKVQARSLPVKDFVFYVVSKKSPNYGLWVLLARWSMKIHTNAQIRYFTILSPFNAVEFNSISGTFAPGYPKIYNTGYDSVNDARCSPVFQARNQYMAEQSRPMIVSPIMTFDCGSYGKHSLAVQPKAGSPYKTTVSSIIYMSPGYVGCTHVSQVYNSNLRSVQEGFIIPVLNSLDITARYIAVSPNEPVRFRVNKDILDFYGSSSFTRSYGNGPHDISLTWSRLTAASSWAMQLDFDVGVPSSSTALPLLLTTKSGRALSSCFTSLVVLMCIFVR